MSLKYARGAGDVVQLVKYLPNMHEALGSIPQHCKNHVVAHIRNSSTREVEGGGPEIQVHPQINPKSLSQNQT